MKIKKKKAILFDFDGTLVDSLNVVLTTFNQVASKHGIQKVKDSDLEKLRDMTALEIIKKYKVPFYKTPIVIKEVKNKVRSQLHQYALHTGIENVLKKISEEKKVDLYVLSSNSIENIRLYLDKHKELKRCFKEIISSNSLFGKHRTISKFLKENNLKTNEVIYIGDEVRDIQACKKLGVEVVSVTWGFNSEKILKQYNSLIANTPEELYQIINERT